MAARLQILDGSPIWASNAIVPSRDTVVSPSSSPSVATINVGATGIFVYVKVDNTGDVDFGSCACGPVPAAWPVAAFLTGFFANTGGITSETRVGVTFNATPSGDYLSGAVNHLFGLSASGRRAWGWSPDNRLFAYVGSPNGNDWFLTIVPLQTLIRANGTTVAVGQVALSANGLFSGLWSNANFGWAGSKAVIAAGQGAGGGLARVVACPESPGGNSYGELLPTFPGQIDWIHLASPCADDANELLLMLQQAAKNPAWDIEFMLDLLDHRHEALASLLADRLFVKSGLLEDRARIGGYSGLIDRVRDYLYDRVIEVYSAGDAQPAARLYRSLFVDFTSWFRNVPSLGRTLPIFTLNYDRSVELAASALQGVRLVDGLADQPGSTERRWSRQEFEHNAEDPTLSNIVLVKLHGSVRWGRRQPPGQRDEVVELPNGLPRDPRPYAHAVLYPTLGPKPLDIEPFRTGYQLIRACLLRTRFLVIIGTTLRDPELRGVIRDSMGENPNLHIALVGPRVSHAETATDLDIDAARLVALRGRFEIPKEGQENAVLGCLRPLADEAYGVARDMGRPRFNETNDCMPTGQLSRSSATAPVRHEL